MKQVLLFVGAMLLTLTVFNADAQVKTPAPSPGATLTQTIGLAEVTIDYSRPGVKDRKVFGELVPYGEMWRTGANGSTDITLSEDAMIGGQTVPAGKYALYATPSESSWEIIIYKDSEIWGTPGDKFTEEDVAVRFNVPSAQMPFDVETFSIGFNNIKPESADLMIYWERTMVSFPIAFDTDKMVSASIDKAMAGPSANDYYGSARYYMDTDKDLKMAHNWITMATDMRNDAFWMYRLKSQIEAKMGDKKMAIESAKKSMELAEKAGNKQYVKFNQDAIKEWSMK